MKKTHQNVPIYATFQGIFLKQLLTKNFEPTKENVKTTQNLRILMIKLLTFNYWSNQIGKSSCSDK